MVECKYRGRVIGWLVTGDDGFPAYVKSGRAISAELAGSIGRVWEAKARYGR